MKFEDDEAGSSGLKGKMSGECLMNRIESGGI